MKRRAQGEGTIYFDKARGRWVGQAETSPDPLTGKRRRVKVLGVAGEKQSAFAKRLKARIVELDAGTETGTVAELVESWMTRAAPKKKAAGALASARSMVDTHIVPAFGSVKIGDLRAEDVERWMDAMGAAGYSKATIRRFAANSLRLSTTESNGVGLLGTRPASQKRPPATPKPPWDGR